jgi:hypothetical protein
MSLSWSSRRRDADYAVQTKVRLPVPPEGGTYDYVQAGLSSTATTTASSSSPTSPSVRDGTWTHHLGDRARIGLVSMGAAPPSEDDPDGGDIFDARFDYVRVWTLAPVR